MKRLDKEIFKIANSKLEEFRKCNAKELLEIEFKENDYKSIEIEGFENFKNENINTIFFANNRLVYQNISDAMTFEDNELIINRLVKKPIVILNYFDEEVSYFKKELKYVLDTDSSCDVLEVFISKGEKNFFDESRKFHIDKDSKLNYTKYQILSEKDFLNISFKQELEEDSSIEFVNFDFGSAKCYNKIDTVLDCENSFFDYDSLIEGKNSQEIANIVTTIHDAKNTKSSVKAKNLLDEKSHGIFEVKSKVNKSAIGSDVIQESKTTLLSDDARINANPRLEIFIDELTASHGATTGSLDEDALFYLQTRGLNEKEASKLILESIKKTVFNKISNGEIIKLVDSL